MRAVLVLALAVSVASMASAATVDPTAVWRPMYPFLGTWKGTRAGANGPVTVTRGYASSATNHHLEITETGGGRTQAAWGIVSFDPERQALVLRHLDADGSSSDLAFDPASTADRLVFASPESSATRTRVTYERAGWNNFVERVEVAAGGGPFTVVAETRFVRKD
jgi:hypothetical protein